MLAKLPVRTESEIFAKYGPPPPSPVRRRIEYGRKQCERCGMVKPVATHLDVCDGCLHPEEEPHTPGRIRIPGLRSIRKDRRRTMEDLATEVGIWVGTVGRHERLERAASKEQRERYAKALDCTLDDLLSPLSEV